MFRIEFAFEAIEYFFSSFRTVKEYAKHFFGASVAKPLFHSELFSLEPMSMQGVHSTL